MTCKCHKDYTKKPQESCLYCAEKHIATAMQAYHEQGYLHTNRQFIIGELELARKHLENYELIAEKIRQFRHDIQDRQVQINEWQWQNLCNMIDAEINNELQIEEKQIGKIYIFSNVEALERNKIQTNKNDLLVFLNKAVTYQHYKKNQGTKIVYRRSIEESYGKNIMGLRSRFVFGKSGIEKEFIDKLKQNYDWNYDIEQGKIKDISTEYIVTEWMHYKYPKAKIILVNFNNELNNSNYEYMCNQKYEIQVLNKYKHIFTNYKEK